jgi:hypothetical protein
MWDYDLNLLAAAAAATTNGSTNWVLVAQVLDCGKYEQSRLCAWLHAQWHVSALTVS